MKHLLSLVAPRIAKLSTSYREPIPPPHRLSATLRHLATGESRISLSLQYRIGRQTISKIIPETCEAIYDVLAPVYVYTPTSSREWLAISKQFEERWNLPHVLGALDGKHIRIRSPNNTGTLYYNYKGFFSMVLLAVCDSNYCFTMFDLGQYGSNNDSGVLLSSEMGKKLVQEKLNIPNPTTLDGCAFDPLPYFLVGDEIFPLKTYLMCPYAGSAALDEKKSVYNYRHSRARHVIENAFGVLVARWRIFNTPIHAKQENVEKIVLATIALHNYLRQTDNTSYCPAGFIDSERATGDIIPGYWRRERANSGEDASQGMARVAALRGQRRSDYALRMRDSLMEYVNSDLGSLSWQIDHVRRT